MANGNGGFLALNGDALAGPSPAIGAQGGIDPIPDLVSRACGDAEQVEFYTARNIDLQLERSDAKGVGVARIGSDKHGRWVSK